MLSTAVPPASPRPAIATAFAAVAFGFVMIAGAWQFVAAARNPDGLQYPGTWLDFREGRMTLGVEKELDKKLPARTDLIAGANTLRYLLTGGGGDQVRVGKDDWLFLTEELRFDAGGAAALNARAELLGVVASELERQGVKLVVALVPDKARVYADQLARGHYPTYNSGRYQSGLSALRARRVTTVDLLQPLSRAAGLSQVYYRSDTHWNQAGAQVAAQAVAAAVQRMEPGLDKTSFSTTNEGGPIERAGDLIRLMGLQDMPNALRPKPDMETPTITRQTSADPASGGLFGDGAKVSVVLTGTSYSMRGNFHGYLQQALSARVLNTAKDGGGFLQAPTAYLTDDAFRLAKPKVLVWELPERFLMVNLDGEDKWLAKVGLRP